MCDYLWAGILPTSSLLGYVSAPRRSVPKVTTAAWPVETSVAFTLTVRTLTPVGRDRKGRRGLSCTWAGRLEISPNSVWPNPVAYMQLTGHTYWLCQPQSPGMSPGPIPGGWRSGSCQGGWPHTDAAQKESDSQPLAGGQPHVCEVNLCRGHTVGGKGWPFGRGSG